jgi:hypothetical protein
MLSPSRRLAVILAGLSLVFSASLMMLIGADAAQQRRRAGPLANAIFIDTTEGRGWRVIGEYEAHRVLVTKIRTDRLEEMEQIARHVVEPSKGRYFEILVYFYRPDSTRTGASGRVQWTAAGGYRIQNYERLDEAAGS